MPYKDLEEGKEYRKRYYLKNIKRLRKQSRERASVNKYKKAEYDREYRLDNLDSIKHKKKMYREENKESIALKKKEWQKTEAYKLYQRVYQHRRRAKVASAGSFTKEDIEQMYKEQKGKCYYGGHISLEDGFHIEHMTPISRGGSNNIDNIALSCANCNFRKRTKTFKEFFIYECDRSYEKYKEENVYPQGFY